MEAPYWLMLFVAFMAAFYVPYYFGYLAAFWLRVAGIAFTVFGFFVAFAIGDWTEGNPIRSIALFLFLVGVILLLVG